MALYVVLICFGLVQWIESGGVPLTECGSPAPIRPVPPPTACTDKDNVLCTAVFAPLGSDAAANANPANPFLVNPFCQNASLRANAVNLCPSSCAVCCLAPEFSCSNAAGADCTPFTTLPDLCTNPQTAPTALEKCPSTCGLCNRPGALGGCPNVAANCAQLLPLLTCTNAYMQANCMTTCNITTCICKCFVLSFSRFLFENATTAAASSCMDTRANCAQMSSFCNISPYSTVMREQCRRTCGICR
ncbi:unnamed protein product [Dracunculus medinensis]|uniref:ShKT domain-containing protein n=1 Tax=Dracunculus medinensis TaxID=318479 RepID=A0A0N4U7D7_DRAME|nr:unnamed protein product [Dracunculus medinensis]